MMGNNFNPSASQAMQGIYGSALARNRAASALARDLLPGDIERKELSKKLKDLKELPKLVEQTLLTDNKIQNVSNTFNEAKGSMFLGRGFSYPIALEGALKLKELSYVHAEGYPAGEMKHGPLALIEEGMPVVVLAPRDNYYKKTISNMQEVIARGAKVLLLTNKSAEEVVSENRVVLVRCRRGTNTRNVHEEYLQDSSKRNVYKESPKGISTRNPHKECL